MAIYKELVRKVSIPADKKTKQKDYLEKGSLPIIDQSQGLIGGYSNDLSKIISCELPVIVFGDHTKCVKFITFPFGAGADGIKVLQPKEGICPQYLFYGTQYLTYRVIDKGYARHYQYIEKMSLDVPSISEQERIVARIEELFSELDKAVETLQTTKRQLAVYRQAVLKEAFSGELTSSWRLSHTGLDSDKIESEIKNNHSVVGFRPMLERVDLPNLPVEWKWVSIGDISVGAEYGTSKKSKEAGKVPVLRMGNIQKGRFVMDALVYSDDSEEISKYMLKKGDVLFNRTNSPELVGKTAAFTDDREAIFAGYLIRINQVPEIDYRFLTLYLNSQTAQSYGNKVKTDGVNQSNINSKKLYSYPYPLCSMEEQLEIISILESRLSVCDSIENTVDTALTQAGAMRQSILKEAFEGRLV